MNLAASERKKYRTCWNYSQYRNHSPGEWVLPIFKQVNRKRCSLIDLGCGTGRAGAKLKEMGYDVTQLDFADNCRDFKVEQEKIPFIESNLWGKWDGEWDMGYCCDVMEHIPPEKVNQVLKNIFKHCKKVFFTIHFSEDNFRRVVGHPLHLTVRPFSWWLDLLSQHGKVKNARDLLGMGSFFVEGNSKCEKGT